MALLSNTTYQRIAKSFKDSTLVLLNLHGESITSKSLTTLAKTKTKINTRWEFDESNNVSPFTHASLVIRGKSVLMTDIKPIQNTQYGFLDIQYESDD